MFKYKKISLNYFQPAGGLGALSAADPAGDVLEGVGRRAPANIVGRDRLADGAPERCQLLGDDSANE